MDFKRGLKDGIPICLGYFSVSVAFGVTAVYGGLTWLEAVMISLFNLTSAGQKAGQEATRAETPRGRTDAQCNEEQRAADHEGNPYERGRQRTPPRASRQDRERLVINLGSENDNANDNGNENE